MKKKVIIIAEIGINHNGDLDIAKQLIDVASMAGCDAIKFQKRKIDSVYSPDELDALRESPWGTTNREQKYGLEFEKDEYDKIDAYCSDKKIDWFASAWDIDSQKFLRDYNLKYNKVASAMLTIEPMLRAIAEEKKYTFISTGMSTLKEIEFAIEIFNEYDCPFELMHCNSSYPMKNQDANLKMIPVLRDKYRCDVGYSGHEIGLQVSLAAVALGATSIERHITLAREMYGSDQSASIEPVGVIKLVRDIRAVESAIGDGIKKMTDVEISSRKKLANPYWLKNLASE
ncbi:MAG: N-acetylneuraminate synthase family protein [Pelagibacterales bacterium]|jgi:N-acetylneuraminate synthase|nr:N-acetylneuraminate synthase family protein [Pelagibacterales bacterium]